MSLFSPFGRAFSASSMLPLLHRWLARGLTSVQFPSSARALGAATPSKANKANSASCSSASYATARRPRPSFDAEHAVHCGGECAAGASAEIAQVAHRFGVSQKALRSLKLEFSHCWGEPGQERSLAVFSRHNSLYFLFGDAQALASVDDAPGLQQVSARKLLSRFSREPVAEPLAAALAPFAEGAAL